MKDTSLISLILVSNKNLQENDVRHIHNYLDNHYLDFELIIILNGDYEKLTHLEGILTELKSIRLINLSYKVAYDVAVSAGIENAIGDYVINFSFDSDPLDSISSIIKKCSLNDLVIGCSNNDSTIFIYIKKFFMQFLKIIGYSLPDNSTNLICLNRRAVNAVTKSTKFHHQLTIRLTKMGLKTTIYEYKSKNTKIKLWPSFKNIMRLLVFNSTKPLRFFGSVGITFSIISGFFCIFYTINYFSRDMELYKVYLSFTLISILLTVLFIMLTFFGEYLSRILHDKNSNHMYDISFEKNSKVSYSQNRLNTTETSK